MHFLPLFVSLVGLAAGHLDQASTPTIDYACPLLGQVYPPPTAIASHPIWQKAKSSLSHAFDTWAPFQKNTSTYAIKMVSLHEPLPFFERYNKAPSHLHGGSNLSTIDGDTMFRVGSVSKIITVYAVLVQCGFKCWEDSITKYIPELAQYEIKDSVTDIDWDEITVGSLASQISGLPRDAGSGDLSVDNTLLPGSQFGLPTAEEMEPDDVPHCSAIPAQQACNRTEYLDMIMKQAPGMATWYSPLYSNMAYQLLGYALENMTGLSYTESLNSLMNKPLKMHNTATLVSPDNKHSIIIPGEPWYPWDMGDGTAAAGIYSSTNDLITHALAVMNHTQLTKTQVNRWLKPVSHTSNLRSSVGAPFEIERHTGTSRYHTIDLMTKMGGLQSYTTYYAIAPELEVAWVIQVLDSDPTILSTEVAKMALPHFKIPLMEIAKAQAVKNFAGKYVDTTPGSNSSFTVTADDDAGLLVSEWINRGVSIVPLRAALNGTNEIIRLYPANLSSKKGSVRSVAFRAWMLDTFGECTSWQKVSKFLWASKSFDAVVFETDDVTGEAYAVELPAFRAKYRKVASGLLVQGEL